MDRTDELAQLLVASWRLGAEDTSIPTSHGLLDVALQKATEQGKLPAWAKSRLHFVDSRTGLRCIELSEILGWAQRAELTSEPNPSYSRTDIKISPNLARRLLPRLDVTEEQAMLLGQALKRGVREAEHQLHCSDISLGT